MMLLLVASYILTNIATLRNSYVDLRIGYAKPKPPGEPYYIMLVYIWMIPIVLLLLISSIKLKNVYKVVLLLLYFLYTSSLVIFITALFRYFFPSPRPYFAELCKSETNVGFLGNPTLCTVDIERRDVQSFPSGHASAVWTSWVYLLLIFTGMTETFRRKGGFYKIVIFVASLLIVPIWMSGERYTSGSHFGFEILFGSILGILVPFVTYYNLDSDLLSS